MTAARSDRPDPEGHHDDLSAEDLHGLSLLVPDDARELVADRDAWLREQGASPLPEPSRAPTGLITRRHRLSITAALVAVSLLVVAVSGVVGALVLPSTPTSAPAAPLASPTSAPGQLGGLLPLATLTDADTPVASRSLRPAVIGLLPADCASCLDLVREVRRQAAEFGLPVTLIGDASQGSQLDALVRTLGSFQLGVLIDPSGSLASAYHPDSPTLLLVDNTGVVRDIVRDPPAGFRLESGLSILSGQIGA